jgi:neurofibromin 1
VSELINLLLCAAENESLVSQIEDQVQQLAKQEMSPHLIPILFDQVKATIDSFFDSKNNRQILVSETSTNFMHHIISILTSILTDRQGDLMHLLAQCSLEPILFSACRYIRQLDSKSIPVIHLRLQYCALLTAMMNRRQDLLFRQEMRFRNKMVEYVSEWVMGRTHLQQLQESPLDPDLLSQLRDLDQAAMQALAVLLKQLPLQPEENDSGDLLDAKSALFLKYFSLFHNILNECSEPPSPAVTSSATTAAAHHLISDEVHHHLHHVNQSSSSPLSGRHPVSSSTTTTTGMSLSASSCRLHHISSSSTTSTTTVTVTTPSPSLSTSTTSELRKETIRAMSNLLSANIDSGLVHSLALGYHRDLQTRAAFMEVLTTILQQGTEFEMLAETILHDRYEQLVSLVTMMGDQGELPIAMALANVVSGAHMDELARVFVTIFDAKHMLSHLLWNIFDREIAGSECMQTLLRGNSLGAKIMSFCFKIYGTSYLKSLLEPLILPLMDEGNAKSYEVDPTRIDEGEEIDVNRDNLKHLTQTFFDTITGSPEQFPPQLRCMAHCLLQVLNIRFPDSINSSSNMSAVGTVFFLRFINPAIVAPYEMGVVSHQISDPKTRRGLTLMSKVLQNIANHVEFSKEQHMLFFNDFLRANFDQAFEWVQRITSDSAATTTAVVLPGGVVVEGGDSFTSPLSPSSHLESLRLTSATTTASAASVIPSVSSSTTSAAFISDANVQLLHRLLWNHQVAMGEYISSSRDHQITARVPFDKLATLLAYLGPAENRNNLSEVATAASHHHWSCMDAMMSTKFEEIMSKFNMHEKDEFKSIQSLNIFYKAGVSKLGHPVFYYIARRFLIGEMNGDLLIYHVILTLKPYCSKPFELVIDFTHCNVENRFRQEFLQKWFVVLPELAYEKCHAAYIYNCNTWVREYTKCLERTLAPLKNHRKLIFLDSMQRLNDYIDPSEQKLPQATLSLEQDLKVYTGLIRLSLKETKVNFKIGPNAIAITSAEKCKVLGHSVFLNDVHFANEIEEVCLVDENQFTLGLLNDPGYLSFIHNECETIVTNLIRIRTRWELSQPDVSTVHSNLRPKDVPGTLLNMALLNLGSRDAALRTAAYNLLQCVIQTFNLSVAEDMIADADPNQIDPQDSVANSQFIAKISQQLSARAFHLTLEFLEEAIRGFRNSDPDHKNLCLDYMVPWLSNLSRLRKHSDSNKKIRLNNVIEQLNAISIEEKESCPLIQDKLWPAIGEIYDIRLHDLPAS